jgi:hypothetical protein
MKKFALLLLVLTCPILCHAEDNCPSLNVATASGELGTANMDLTVTRPNNNNTDVICDFTKHEGTIFRELRIEVLTPTGPVSQIASYTARCNSKPMPLKAIGNEAWSCTMDAKNGLRAAQVFGKLRDSIFIVQVTANSAWASREELIEKTCSLADQITGNLF